MMFLTTISDQSGFLYLIWLFLYLHDWAKFQFVGWRMLMQSDCPSMNEDEQKSLIDNDKNSQSLIFESDALYAKMKKMIEIYLLN